MNLTDLGSLAHSAENLLDQARKGRLVLAGDNSDVLFELIDMLKKTLAALTAAIKSGQPVASQDLLPPLLEKLTAAAEGRMLAETQDTPQVQANDKKLDAILEDKPEAKKAKSSTASVAHAADEKIKVSTTRLDNLINMTGELVIAQLMVGEEIATAPNT